MYSPTESEIEAAKAAHGQDRVRVFEKNGFTFLLRIPKGIEIRRHMNRLAEDKKNFSDANQELALTCVLGPARPELLELFDDFGVMVSEVAGELLALAANSEKAEAKKV